MTREEAIEKLNNAKGCPLLYDSHIEAIGMAIQALSQEPRDDAISRDAVIDAIRFGISNIRAFNDTTMIRFYERENEALKKAIERVNKLPSVTQKSGKWIAVTNGRGGHECSLCHEYTPSYQDGDEWLTKYCPNCGAKMVKPQESEDKK